jgi:hypothetical protein
MYTSPFSYQSCTIIGLSVHRACWETKVISGSSFSFWVVQVSSIFAEYHSVFDDVSTISIDKLVHAHLTINKFIIL